MRGGTYVIAALADDVCRARGAVFCGDTAAIVRRSRESVESVVGSETRRFANLSYRLAMFMGLTCSFLVGANRRSHILRQAVTEG